jgi:hypothetical protein
MVFAKAKPAWLLNRQLALGYALDEYVRSVKVSGKETQRNTVHRIIQRDKIQNHQF